MAFDRESQDDSLDARPIEDMRALIAARDWSATPLGPMTGWPHTLRTAVELILPNRFASVILWGREFIQVYNDSFRAMLADRHPRALGEPARECWPEAWHVAGPIYERVWHGESLMFEDALYPIVRNGSLEDTWCDLCYSPIRDETGSIQGVLVTVIEVTARHLARLQQQRDDRVTSRLAAIVESSDVAIISKGLDGVIQTWNAGAQHIFGYTAEEAVGQPVTILMPAGQEDGEPAILARIRQGERIDHYEAVWRRKDGTLIDVALTISPIKDRSGEPVAVSNIARDISRRKRADTALREVEERRAFLLKLADAIRPLADAGAIQQAACRILRAQLGADCICCCQTWEQEQSILVTAEDGAPEDIALVGQCFRLADFQDSAAAMFRELRPVGCSDLDSLAELSPEQRGAFAALRMRAYLAVPVVKEGRLAGAMIAKSGTPRHWSARELQLLGDTAERTWDAARRASTEAALRESEAQLQRASRAKDEFIAMLGHELRNPLAPIATTLELMKLRGPDVFVREREIIEAQVRHLTALVDDLLDVARIARGKVELQTEEVDIAAVVAAAVEITQPLMEERRQSLRTDVAEGLAVEGDKRRLAQVVVNLLTNAAKYSPPGREIEVRAARENRQVVLSVRDQGQGIDPALLPHVFELFTQDARSVDRQKGGLGLGLAIVRNLVALHGGTVAGASQGRGKGSEFTVRLPLAARRRNRGASKAAATSAAEPPRRPARARVLVVDDYALAAESLALLLGEMGYATRVAHDGPSGLQAVAEFDPDIALVDIGLPVMDGYEVARAIRRTPGRECLPLVAITGFGQPSDHLRAKEAGFDEHLVKPLEAGKIGQLIDTLVEARACEPGVASGRRKPA
jgi:PAS domain S-box-containing protein